MKSQPEQVPEHLKGTSRPPHVWRGSQMLWVAVNACAFAVGLFPGLVLAPGSDVGTPVLQTVVLVQIVYALLIYPHSMAVRLRVSSGRLTWGELVELTLIGIVGAPFVVAGAWLSDASVIDAVRAVLLVAAVFLAGGVLARLAAMNRRGAQMAAWVGVAAVLGLPAAAYLAGEFAPMGCPDWLIHVCPPMLAWSVADARQIAFGTASTWMAAPRPYWAWALWPAVAIFMWCVRNLGPVGPADRQ